MPEASKCRKERVILFIDRVTCDETRCLGTKAALKVCVVRISLDILTSCPQLPSAKLIGTQHHAGQGGGVFQVLVHRMNHHGGERLTAWPALDHAIGRLLAFLSVDSQTRKTNTRTRHWTSFFFSFQDLSAGVNATHVQCRFSPV